MNVLHVIPSIAAEDGGPTAALAAMARGLADAGTSVTVVATRPRSNALTSSNLSTVLQHPRVQCRLFSRTLPGEWKYSRSLGEWLRENVAQFDVVHVHALFTYATIPGCRNAERAGIPYVLRPLGTLDRWSLAQGRWKKRPYLALIERRHLDGAAAIHVTSESEASAVLELVSDTRRVRVIPLGVDLPPERRRLNRSDRFRILFLSRLHPKKGLPILLQAVAGIHRSGTVPLELTVAGDGSSGYRTELEKICDSLGIRERVSFVGHVEGEVKAALFANADVFALPSHQENFGIAVAEAMAAGLPVVISDQVGLAPAIASAGAGFVLPLNAEAFTEALLRLHARADLRERMGDSGRRLVQEQFSWRSSCARLAQLYEELVSRSAKARAEGTLSRTA